LNQDTLGLLETRDPWEMQEGINWDLDNSREFAHGYKERR